MTQVRSSKKSRLWRAWDTRAWASGRPDKITPQPGADVHGRWLAELAALGYRDPTWPIQLALPLAGAIDRDAAAAEVLSRLGAARSAWNAADVRGEAEQLLARSGLVAEPAVRDELAEDLTARARDLCLHLVEGAPPGGGVAQRGLAGGGRAEVCAVAGEGGSPLLAGVVEVLGEMWTVFVWRPRVIAT